MFITDFKVLLKKNFLTLKRNVCFAVFFVLLPVVTMGIYVLVQSLLEPAEIPEKNNLERKSTRLPIVKYFTSTSSEFTPLFSDTDIFNTTSYAASCYGFKKYAVLCDPSDEETCTWMNTFRNVNSIRFIIIP